MQKLITYIEVADPTPSNNAAAGFAVGHFWRNTTSGDLFYQRTDGVWVNISKEEVAIADLDTIYASITHNHNLNDLAEKSYNSLTDTPSLDFEPANDNIQLHIGDGDIHVTSTEKSTWNNKKNKASKIAVSNGNTYTLADNTEYRGVNIETITFKNPIGDFECWIRLTTASSGTIDIQFDNDIISEPEIGNDETWEFSVKDGVILAIKS